MVDGASFILDIPPGTPAVWGEGSSVLWAEGEALMICGPPGVGKTTLMGQVLLALIGLRDSALGLPVKTVDKVLYLAMDRPKQIARALARTVTESDRETLTERLMIWPGPPPQDLARNPDVLAELANEAKADVVIIDSLKDAAIKLSEDEVGSGYNRARQTLLRDGVEIAELHHTVKRSEPTLDSVYGSTWLTSGAGSVVMLTGNPGDPIIGFQHLKQPADTVGPWRLNHDQDAGAMTIEGEVNPLQLAREAGSDGVTAKDVASRIFETKAPDKNQIETARRKLAKLTKDGQLTFAEGRRGGPPATWYSA
ncbi:AAA family ATPase [Rhodococcus oryzae]|uniref:AAA family ATPase n=1 Tax=Rhodococcus oryzae TaxID=2571143 RepID=UPI003716DC28